MSALTSTTTNCYYCSLPITAKSIAIKIADEEAAFCCYGCFLVFQVTGKQGETGQPVLIMARLLAAFAAAMVTMIFSWPRYFSLLVGQPLPTGGQLESLVARVYEPLAATIVIALLGVPIARNAWALVRQGQLGLDPLIALGAFSAYGLSLVATIIGRGNTYYDTASMILVFVTAGRFFESESKAKVALSLKNLFDLAPPTAQVWRNGAWTRTSADAVRVGEHVRVLPGEAFPVDGAILEGEGGVNEAALTGESAPRFKTRGDKIYAGTQSVDGSFTAEAQKVGADLFVRELERLVETAKQSKAPVQRVADRLAGVLTPLIVALALASFGFWTWRSGSAETGMMIALSVVLISCPCALGIATPLALWVGLAEAAKRGVLIRTNAVLENLGRSNHLFFDKTGTLTSGQFQLAWLEAADEWRGREREALAQAAALEAHSEHPLGQAIVRAVAGHAGYEVFDFRALPGLGVRGRIGAVDAPVTFIGSARLMEREGIATDGWRARVDAQPAASRVYFGQAQRVRAVLGLTEEVRAGAHTMVAQLRALGLRLSMLTGDSAPAAQAVARALGLDGQANLLPDEKVSAVRTAVARGERVAMLGDGINDAPALAAAQVGIAMGNSTDLARSAADVVLMSAQLDRVAWLFKFARRVRRAVVVNLFWAFFYNALGLALAVAGLLHPGLSALAMVLSSILVISNSRGLRTRL